MAEDLPSFALFKEEHVQLGIHLPHIGHKAGPDAIRRAAVQAEELGFADVWVSEHVILPRPHPIHPPRAFTSRS